MVTKSVKRNKLAIGALEPRTSKYEVSVAGHPGLIVRVWPSGARKYIYRHRQDGQLRRIALRATALAEAEREWSELRLSVRNDVDVSEQRRQQRAAEKLKRVENRRDPTVAELVDRFIEEYAKRHKRSWRTDENRLRKYAVQAWGPVKARQIKRADVHALVHRIAAKGKPIQANRVLAAVRKMFSYALDAGVIDSHPCLRMKAPAAERTCTRVLTDSEIRALWTKGVDSGLPVATWNALRLQLLSACRIGEVVGAEASEFDLEAGVWTLPADRTKNGLEHAIPLSTLALALVRPIAPTKGALFPSIGKSGHLRADTVAHHLNAATLSLGVSLFGTHDIRRTVATRLGELGFSQEVRQRVLNHKNTSMLAMHYDRYDHLKEKREALEAWGQKLDAIVTGKQSDNVIALKRRPK